MKSIKKDKKKSLFKYPSLWTQKNTEKEKEVIILMYDDDRGTVVYRGKLSCYYVGYFAANWIQKELIPYDGEITLSNDRPIIY